VSISRRPVRPQGTKPSDPEEAAVLSVSSYPQEHIDACRAWAEQATAALRRATPQDAAVLGPSLVLALDAWFVHRARGKEGKDGNPMNEVRVLCAAIVDHGGTLTPPSGIRLRPATSVLGLEPGPEVAVDADGFARLADGFLAAVQRAYV
jgi:hypothetical protein